MTTPSYSALSAGCASEARASTGTGHTLRGTNLRRSPLMLQNKWVYKPLYGSTK